MLVYEGRLRPSGARITIAVVWRRLRRRHYFLGEINLNKFVFLFLFVIFSHFSEPPGISAPPKQPRHRNFRTKKNGHEITGEKKEKTMKITRAKVTFRLKSNLLFRDDSGIRTRDHHVPKWVRLYQLDYSGSTVSENGSHPISNLGVVGFIRVYIPIINILYLFH